MSPLPEHVRIQQLGQHLDRFPDDFAAGMELGSLHFRVGDTAGSIRVLQALLARHGDRTRPLLLLARSQASAGDARGALGSLARAQRVDPAEPRVWKAAAALASQIRDWTELARVGTEWTRFDPQSPDAWQALARASYEVADMEAAIRAFSRVIALAPDDPMHRTSAARIAIAAREYERARRWLEDAEALGADCRDLAFVWARLCHLTGRLDDALIHCQRAVAASPGFAPAWIELGALREGRLDDAELAAVSRLFDDPGTDPDYRVALGFTLASAYDARDACERAFACLELANEMGRGLAEQEGYRYDPAAFEEEFTLQCRLFEHPLPAIARAPDSTAPAPIFVVGMPRTGTTLVESILEAHSAVHAGGELGALQEILDELLETARMRGVEAARDLLVNASADWRDRYLNAMPASPACSWTVDKQPLNFRAIGLIRHLFPAAPVIHMTRSPLDVGLSIYRHRFSSSWPCSFRLRDIGHYHCVHDRMMRFWTQREPGTIHGIDHADLVSAPEHVTRRLLDFVGLAFESGCLEPHRHARPIATFSSVQVRRPVSTAYSGRARRYAHLLGPLQEALDRGGVASNSTQGM